MNLNIINKAMKNNTRFFLQFGGQGAPWIKEFARYYNDSKMKNFYNAVISAINEAIELTGKTDFLPAGFNIKSWLDNEDKVPQDDYLFMAPYSMPMIQAAQFAHFEYLTLNGFNRSNMLKFSKGATGHSQGIISAAFSLLDLDDENYYKAIKQYTKYLFFMGLRSQEAYPEILPNEKQILKSAELENKPPAPMAAVLGETHEKIQKMTEEINKELPENEQIYISLYNTPKNRILSSTRNSLLQFQAKFNEELKKNEIDFIYLKASCPFHSPLLKNMIEPFKNDLNKISFHLTASDIKQPLYSFFDGRNFQLDEEIPMQICEEITIKTLNWEKALSMAAKDNLITEIIDFGPGKTSQRLSTETLTALKSEIPVYSAAVVKDQKFLLEI
ncbi:MAG: hypothetical protein OEZ22_10615 [Spirochaetia bacterium]|nr:hypothetical protein [Spirochaetia bacterium]